MRRPLRIRHGDVEGLRVGRWGERLNTTAVVYRLGSTYVDTGPPNQWRRVRAWAAERPPTHVVLTHHHEDHSGNAGPLARRFGATVHAPRASLELLAEGWPMAFYRLFYWGRPPTVQARPVPERLELGDLVLVPIVAPGHDQDMVVYLEPDRGLLFSADLYIASRPTHLRKAEDVGLQIETLRLVLQHDFHTLLCPHRGPVPEGRVALTRKLEYLEALRERARSLRREGHDVAHITRVLLGREEGGHLVTAGDFSKRNLVESCLK